MTKFCVSVFFTLIKVLVLMDQVFGTDKDVSLIQDVQHRQGDRVLLGINDNIAPSYKCSQLQGSGRIAQRQGCDSDLECFDCVVFFGVPHWVEYSIGYLDFYPGGCDDNHNYFYKGEIEEYDWYEDEFIYTLINIYWDIDLNRWILYNGDLWSFGYCNEINIADCNGKWTVRYEDTHFWYSGDDYWDNYGADGIGVDVCTEWDGVCGSYGCSYILGMQCWDCLTILNIDNSDKLSYNIEGVKFSQQGCFNTFFMWQGVNSQGITLYIVWDNFYKYWKIIDELNDNIQVIGYCHEVNIKDCDGEWQFFISGDYGDTANWIIYTGTVDGCGVSTGNDNGVNRLISDSDGTNSTTTTNNNFTSNCTNNIYGSSICIYNDGSLWNDGIVTFIFDGCLNNYPFYYYNYRNLLDDIDIMLYLHYYNNQWLISESSVTSMTGIAYCNENELSSCVYNNWYVLTTDSDSDSGEVVDVSIDTSMGYDANCDSTDNNNIYTCKSDDVCAFWMVEYSISAENSQIYSNQDLCGTSSIYSDLNDEILSCVLSVFIDSDVLYASINDNNNYCNNEFEMLISLNISFANKNGLINIYEKYNNNSNGYETILSNTCDNNDLSSLTMNLVSTNLDLCNGCSDYVYQNENENQSQSSNIKYCLLTSFAFAFGFGLLQLIAMFV